MMDFNFPQNVQYCGEIVKGVAELLNYTHIPSALAVLFVGVFVLFKTKYSLLGKILFSISLVFSVWAISNLIIWRAYYENSVVMAAWTQIEIWALLLFALLAYFVYVFVEKKDASIWLKWIVALPILLGIYLSTTHYNILWYDVQECIATENDIFQNYILSLKILFSFWIVAFSVYKYFKVDPTFKRQILLLAVGITLFLLSFTVSGYISEQTDNFSYEAMGLLGMVVFVGFLGYLIVRYKTLNIKVIAAQALVVSLIFLTGAGLFYVNGITDVILTVSRFVLICVAGYFLSKSVQREVEQKEKIEALAVELETANVQLKDLDRQKDELLSIVSHQLATPVSAVKWNLEMMLDGDDGKLTKEVEENIKSLQGITGDLSDLVSMILDVSRIQLGRMKIEKQELDLSVFFKEILGIITPKAQQKKVKFDVSIPEEFPKAMLDKRYTHMTIENLLSNAIKYTPEGGTVSFKIDIKDNVMHCQVKDTGVGIPKKDQDKIFGKMFRASNVQNTVDGNGFGLYVAKGSVESQGGKIWFESEENKGTAFFVELPLC